MSGRTAIFVDGGHLRSELWRFPGRTRIDFQKLAALLCGGSEHLRTLYYDARPVDGSLDGFLAALRYVPNLAVRLGTLVQNDNGRQQKMVDMLLALDLVTMSAHTERLQNVVLLTGDGDFVPAIEQVKAAGIKVVVVHGHRASHDLLRASDQSWRVDQGFVDSIRMCERPACACVAAVEEKPATAPCVRWPEITRTMTSGESRNAAAGEVVDVVEGATATVALGGTAIARPGSTVHALKGAKVYLFRDVNFSGTKGFTLIPCS